MACKIIVMPQAEKQLKKLPKNEFLRVDKQITSLQNDPRPAGCKKLQGIDGVYRIRSGNYRIVYSIQDDRLIIEIIRIGDRKDVYRK